MKEAGTDPIKRAGIIRDIIESIAKIPDEIKAAVFIRECSNLLQVEERTLLSELSKMRIAKFKKSSGNSPSPQTQSFQQHQNTYQPYEDGPPDNLFESSGLMKPLSL